MISGAVARLSIRGTLLNNELSSNLSLLVQTRTSAFYLRVPRTSACEQLGADVGVHQTIWQQNDWFASECAPLSMVRLLYELSVPACELFTWGLRVSIDHLPSELE